MSANCVTSAGQLFAIKEETLIVELLITLLLKYYKERNMIWASIFGVWES